MLVAIGGVVAALVILTNGGRLDQHEYVQHFGTNDERSSAETQAQEVPDRARLQPGVGHGRRAERHGDQPARAPRRPEARRCRLQAGRRATAADQTHQTTIVAYMPGHQRDASQVAAALKLEPASVQAVDPSTQAVACPAGTAACTATVVVTVGADLANIQ